MDGGGAHIGLAMELIMSAVLLVVVTIVHGTGIGHMDRVLNTSRLDLTKLRLAQREIGVMIPMALYLMALHIVEIFIFAAFYLATDDAHSVRDAIYHSALAYTTLGVSDAGITKWGIVAAFEGLAGFLMIGWSAAVFVADMDRLLRQHK